MAKFEKKLAAFALRREGYSIGSIAEKLCVSKSSASTWCRDLALTPEQQETLTRNATEAGNIGRIKGALAMKRKKEARIKFHQESGRNEMKGLSAREFFVVGIALYWAEGSRKSKFAFVNSEPQMIQFMARWLHDALNVAREEFMPRIFINAIHESRIEAVRQFWANLLEVPVEQFGNPVFLRDRPKKIYENHDSYYGVLHLGVHNSGELKYRVLGLIEALRDGVLAGVA